MHDLKKVMDPNQLLVFDAYESALDKNIDEWRATKKEGRLDTDPKVREIATRICSNWAEIMSLLGSIRYKISDHYEYLLKICLDNRSIT